MTWGKWLYLGLWAVEGIFLLLFRYLQKPEWDAIFGIWFLGVLTTFNLGFLMD